MIQIPVSLQRLQTPYCRPPPQALLQEFGESALRFELRAFVDFGLGLVAKDQLLVALDKAFRDVRITPFLL